MPNRQSHLLMRSRGQARQRFIVGLIWPAGLRSGLLADGFWFSIALAIVCGRIERLWQTFGNQNRNLVR